MDGAQESDGEILGCGFVPFLFGVGFGSMFSFNKFYPGELSLLGETHLHFSSEVFSAVQLYGGYTDQGWRFTT